jgi:hypothetical protein
MAASSTSSPCPSMVPLYASRFWGPCWHPALHGATVGLKLLGAPIGLQFLGAPIGLQLLGAPIGLQLLGAPIDFLLCRPQPLDSCQLPALGAPVGSLFPVVLSYSWCLRRPQLPVAMSAQLLILPPAPFLVLPLAPCFGAPVGHPCTWCPFSPHFLVPLSAPAPGARLSGCSQTAWHPNTNNGLGIGAWGAGLIV